MEDRVVRLERVMNSVQSNVFGDDKSEGHVRVENDILIKGIRGAAIIRVPSHYYSLTLSQRANLLCTSPDRLCKTLIMENVLVSEHPTECDWAAGTLTKSKYIAVVLQYTHKLVVENLQRFVDGGRAGATKLVYARAGPELTGFAFNGITIFGGRCNMPIVIARAALQAKTTGSLPPSSCFLWLGGGEPDLKLRIPVVQLAPLCHQCNCSEERSEDDSDDS
jgi:prolyl-tRNA editing enzyme YbaK/EbsC (Cys-tRNA(Pro) deacylase)